MDFNEIVEIVADRYGVDIDTIEKDEDGKYRLSDDYDFQSGCYINHTWLDLASVVYLIKEISDMYY